MSDQHDDDDERLDSLISRVRRGKTEQREQREQESEQRSGGWGPAGERRARTFTLSWAKDGSARLRRDDRS